MSNRDQLPWYQLTNKQYLIFWMYCFCRLVSVSSLAPTRYKCITDAFCWVGWVPAYVGGLVGVPFQWYEGLVGDGYHQHVGLVTLNLCNEPKLFSLDHLNNITSQPGPAHLVGCSAHACLITALFTRNCHHSVFSGITRCDQKVLQLTAIESIFNEFVFLPLLLKLF